VTVEKLAPKDSIENVVVALLKLAEEVEQRCAGIEDNVERIHDLSRKAWGSAEVVAMLVGLEVGHAGGASALRLCITQLKHLAERLSDLNPDGANGN
jgi:hypothetical protein